MKVSKHLAERHSEDDFAERLRILADSGAAVIHVRTNEIVRATVATRKAVLIDGHTYNEWDVANGFRQFDITTMLKINTPGDGNTDIHSCMAIPAAHIADAEQNQHFTYFVYINPQYWLEGNPLLTHYLQQYARMLGSTNIRIVLITPDTALPDPLNDTVVTLRFEPPAHAELRYYLSGVVEGVDNDIISISEDDIERICYAGAGMSREAFEMYVSLAIVDAAVSKDSSKVEAEDLIQGINQGKTEIVNKNDILELYQPEDMNDVGGMENLKEWVAKRANCYSDEAKDFGIEPPKGIVFVGLPGTGKSLAAKAIAKELGVPLVRLDFGRVFNSLVGKSEERVRTALKMVESMAPCVLFCDEIDKGLGGIGGSGDSGTSSRVLGTFLTWLQENKTPVFSMVTANNINGLPPELLRRGRFDAIFSTGFPTSTERREVLAIHLRKRGWSIKDLSREGVQAIVNASSRYVPAEIEAAVKDGLVDAFSAGEDFTADHVVEALKKMVPISKTYNVLIQEMAIWMASNATPASRKYEDINEDDGKVTNMVRRTRIRPKKDDD